MSEPEIDDLTLARVQRGEQAAAQRFVARYQALVFAVVARVLGRDNPDVTDASQEVFLRAFGALETFDPRGSAKISSWLATIATRVALDLVRRRRPVLSLDEARELADPRLGDPGEALDAAARRVRLAAAMDALSPEQRAAMTLRVEHGMDYDTIARAMGVEVGTVKSRLARARQALHAAVGTHAHERESHG